MRVAVVCPYDLGRPGGVQQQAAGRVRWLEGAGHEALLVGPGTRGPDGAILLGPTTVVPINRSRAPVSLDPRVRTGLRRAVEAFEVVHVHEPFVPVVGTAALGFEGPAVVATFHADPPGWVRAGVRSFGRRALRRPAVVTAVSPVAGRAVEGLVNYRVIPNGLDVAGYSTGPKVANRVTFLGRDDRRKGLDVLLQAWPAVHSAMPGATLHVLGAERVGPPAGVTFLGRVSESVKLAELGAATIHCAPNLGGESFGVALVEGLASGAAVVASRIPAFQYVAGEVATFIDPGDAAELAEVLISLLGDPGGAAAAGRAGRERAAQFDWSVVGGRYLEAYADALKK